MKLTAMLLAGVLVLAAGVRAQINVRSTEKIPLDARTDWHMPRFAPDGSAVFVTTSDFTGIWRYDLTTRSLSQVTDAPHAGYGFAVAADGSHVTFRTSTIDPVSHVRAQKIIEKDIAGGVETTVASGRDLPAPQFDRSAFALAKGISAAAPQEQAVTYLGIENTKIVVQVNGIRKILDPFKNGSYIWPSLAPDGTKILASAVGVGAFVCNLDGKVLMRLGKRNAPSWTRDGKWIVYMKDVDDGQKLLSSDLYCVSADGAKQARLTRTSRRMEMYPECSRVDNAIVYSTAEGEVYLMRYEEAAR